MKEPPSIDDLDKMGGGQRFSNDIVFAGNLSPFRFSPLFPFEAPIVGTDFQRMEEIDSERRRSPVAVTSIEKQDRPSAYVWYKSTG